ncbi:hypothetical protein [Streptomyces sp. NPDC091268]|uniref:hypothetical protein n=1 Tax=Streptomyces sp. NPDC091268 TaxID=3365979 RepID=UPI0037F232C1
MIQLDFLPEETMGHDRGPRGKMNFETADLYDLTSEAFRAPVTFAVDGADYSGQFPVLDVALGLLEASNELDSQKRTRYCVADAGIDFHFERKGNLVTVRMGRGPKGTVDYEEFCTAAQVFIKKTLRELPKRFPGLSKNPEVQALRRRYL